MNFLYINMFGYEEHAVVRTMCDLTSVVFENIDITYPMELEQRIAYMQRTQRVAELKNTRRF